MSSPCQHRVHVSMHGVPCGTFCPTCGSHSPRRMRTRCTPDPAGTRGKPPGGTTQDAKCTERGRDTHGIAEHHTPHTITGSTLRTEGEHSAAHHQAPQHPLFSRYAQHLNPSPPSHPITRTAPDHSTRSTPHTAHHHHHPPPHHYRPAQRTACAVASSRSRLVLVECGLEQRMTGGPSPMWVAVVGVV